MLYIHSSNNSIEISVCQNGKTPCRFPNQLIWDVNSYLSKYFSLYEYYFATETKESNEIKVPCTCFFKKSLCFRPLDISYISLTDFDSNACKSDYEKYGKEIEDYKTFVEYYTMQEIDDLEYIGVGDFSAYINRVVHSLDKKHLVFRKKAQTIACANADVAVHLGDLSYMTIQAEDSNIIADILTILKAYVKT